MEQNSPTEEWVYCYAHDKGGSVMMGGGIICLQYIERCYLQEWKTKLWRDVNNKTLSRNIYGQSVLRDCIFKSLRKNKKRRHLMIHILFKLGFYEWIKPWFICSMKVPLHLDMKKSYFIIKLQSQETSKCHVIIQILLKVPKTINTVEVLIPF